MKNYLIAIALMLSVGILPTEAQSKVEAAADRMAQKAEQMAQKAEELASKAEQMADMAEDQAEGVVAYSDTTGTDDADSAYVTISRGGKNVRLSVPADWIDDDDFTTANGSIQINGLSGLMSTLRELMDGDELSVLGPTFGAFGVMAVVILIGLFLFVILPIIILAFFLRYLVKRHNQNVQYRNNFQSNPSQGEMSQNSQFAGDARQDPLSPEGSMIDNSSYQWQRGVRNTSIGVGLALLFKLMGMNGLVGIGVLIAILGIGQMVISKTSK
ncbi:MAG: hypothetical protein IJ539_07430 [Prevotella sp.]|nr:hypothetical protein [Prevotella sp.]